MTKRLVRTLTPGPIRRAIQGWRLRRAINAFTRRVVQHKYGSIWLQIELSDPLAAGWYDHDWDPLPEIILLRGSRLAPGALVFDCGAHQGVVGLMLAHEVGPTGTVVLVEPSEHNAAACIRNAELNRIGWITTKRAAVAEKSGLLLFNSGLNGQAAELSDYAGSISVPVTTIDDMAQEFGNPDVVFLDIEGYECRALSGAQKTLASNADWFIEAHVGAGLEAAGGSVDEILSRFPESAYDRFVHTEGDPRAVSLDEQSQEKLLQRCFLTFVCRRSKK